MRLRILALVLLLAPACAATAPEARGPELPYPAPETWSRSGAEGELARDWWESFGDAGLSEAIREALRRNPVLAGAEARVRAAAALARIAGADLAPQLTASARAAGGETFLGKNAFTDPTGHAESYGVSLDLSWEADVWGRIRAGRSAAIADLETARALADGAALSLTGQTAKAWFAAVEALGQVDLARANLASAEDLAARVRDRFEQGLRTALDLKLVEGEVEGARARLLARERARDAALRQVETLVARFPEGLLETDADLPGLPGPVPAGLPADLVARRPDLVAAERTLAAAGARVAGAEAALYPRISLTASGGLASSDFEDLLDGDYGVWTLAANLAAPLLDGGRLRAARDLEIAREDEAAAAFAERVLNAFREVETALAAERFLAAEESVLAAAAAVTRDGEVISGDRYLAGLVDILAVLEARRRAFTAESEHLAARRRKLDARVDLVLALGGGFGPSKTLSAETAR